MHEYSVVRALVSQVIDAARPLPPSDIRSITVAAGPLSGVEPLLVHRAFEDLKTDAGLTAAKLIIDEVSLNAVCLVCEVSFEILDFVFRCPQCQSSSVQITQGDEFRLLRLEVVDCYPEKSDDKRPEYCSAILE